MKKLPEFLEYVLQNYDDLESQIDPRKEKARKANILLDFGRYYYTEFLPNDLKAWSYHYAGIKRIGLHKDFSEGLFDYEIEILTGKEAERAKKENEELHYIASIYEDIVLIGSGNSDLFAKPDKAFGLDFVIECFENSEQLLKKHFPEVKLSSIDVELAKAEITEKIRDKYNISDFTRKGLHEVALAILDIKTTEYMAVFPGEGKFFKVKDIVFTHDAYVIAESVFRELIENFSNQQLKKLPSGNDYFRLAKKIFK